MKLVAKFIANPTDPCGYKSMVRNSIELEFTPPLDKREIHSMIRNEVMIKFPLLRSTPIIIEGIQEAA